MTIKLLNLAELIFSQVGLIRRYLLLYKALKPISLLLLLFY